MVTAVEREGATWADWLGRALAEGDLDRRAALLGELVLASNKHVLSAERPRPVRLPAGQAPKSVLRAAGAALVELGDDTTAHRRARRALGLLAARVNAQRGPDGDDAELRGHHDDVATAAGLVAALDPALEMIVLNSLSLRQRDLLDSTGSLATARRMIELGRQAPASSLLHALHPDARWLPPHRDLVQALLVAAHARAAIAARFLRDYPEAIAQRDAQVTAAERLRDVLPSLVVDALGQRAALARDLGDVRTSVRLLEQQTAIAEAAPGSTEAAIVAGRSRAAQAQFLDDWEEERRQQLHRLARRLGDEGHGDVPLTPSAVADVVEALFAADKQRELTNIGNVAYELGRNLIDSGRTADDAAADEAQGWFAVARAAWREIGMNGLIAVDFRELELAALRGRAGSPYEVGQAMVRASREWRRPAGQRRAAIRAAWLGGPGDDDVRIRLEELRATAPAVDAAHLAGGLARWHLRAGDAAPDPARAVAAWRRAVEHAATAEAGLSVPADDGPPVLLDPAQYVAALQTHAEAVGRLAAAGTDDGSPELELALRLRTLPGIARRVSSAGGPEQRRVRWTSYAPWLADTVTLAVGLGDAAAADHVAEVARRDQIGTVLRSLAHDPELPELARLARELTATLRSVVTDTTDDGTPPSLDRAVVIDDQLTEALDVMGSVVGPVARTLFDPAAVLGATCADVLAASRAPAAAVLSLWLMPGERLLRRLAWRDGERAGTALDVVDVPAGLVDLDPSRSTAQYFGRLARLRDVLLPADLLALLRAADPAHPIDLVVVPTGVMTVSFAALEVDDERLVLDVATVTVVQSLQTAAALTTPVPGAGEPYRVATYDTRRLAHTAPELDALREHLPPVAEARSLADLRAFLTEPGRRGAPGVLALALHGLRGSDGWSQSKILPSGETLTTSHVLEWFVPQLVVSASCNTDIRADDGGELGGFPLAFQLRGAATVIGTLTDVEDEATGQIMAHLYAYLSGGAAPAAALRLAQRAWIAADPDQRLADRRRWSFLVAYGLPGPR